MCHRNTRSKALQCCSSPHHGTSADLFIPDGRNSSGKVGFTLLTVLVGIFGINGAAVAQALIIDSLFNGFLPGIGISMELWGMIVLIGHQITSYAYPGVDMIGAMGLAHAKNIKPMLKLSYFAIIPGTVILACIAALIL